MAAAAFYDLDGTLVRTNLVHAFAYNAQNQQGLWRSLVRTTTTLASVPLFAAADFYSRRLFNDVFFRRYQGESEDRLRYLAEELFENVIRPSIFPGAYELIDKSKRLGLRQVLVTGALDLTVLPLARHLGIDDWVTNRLEYVEGKATGRLLPPVMAAATKASWMRVYAETRGAEPLRLLQLLGQHERPAHAVGGGTSHGGEPRLPPAQHGPATRLADSGSAGRDRMRAMREREPKTPARADAPAQRGRPGRLHRHQLRPPDHVLGRGLCCSRTCRSARGSSTRSRRIEGLVNPGAAIRYALNHPLEAEPLYAQLMPGMQVTIAVDDICLPLPPMATPDIRQTVLEIVLELLDANGVDDVDIDHRQLAAPAHDRRPR